MGINAARLQDWETDQTGGTTPKRGAAIFANTDYPRQWQGFIGQAQAKEQLEVQVASATARGTRIEHTLIESGIEGVGKTTLATILAFQAGVGFLQTTGPLDVDQARKLMLSMKDRDILFIDEAHQLGKNKDDWLLPFMTEGVLYTKRGPEQMPDIAIVAATTEPGRLLPTVLGRFMCTPNITGYSDAEASLIAANLAERMGINLGARINAECIAIAADSNPRRMRKILTGVRDLSYAYPTSHPNLAKAFAYAKVSGDGLTLVARDILLTLLISPNHTCSIDTIHQKLGEPGPLKHDERALLQRGLIDITARGRVLTDPGVSRARAEARERLGIEA